jgi:ATP-binding cassette subfamily B protein
MDFAYYEDDRRDDISSRKAFGRLMPILKPFIGWLVFCFVLLGVSKVLYIIGPNLIRRAIDIDIANSDYRGLLYTVAMYIILQAGFLFTNYIFRVRMEIIGQRVLIGLRKTLFGHILKMSVSFFDRNPVGRLMARVESDTEALRMLFTNTVVQMVGAIMLIIGMFIWMFLVSAKLTLVVLASLPVTLTVLYIYHRYTTPKWLEIRKRMADITASLTEFFGGMQVIQIFDRAREVRRRMNEVNRRKYLPELKAELSVVAMFNFVFFMETLIIASVLYVGTRWAGIGDLTIGTLVMFISYIRMLFEPIHIAAEELAVVQKAVGGAKRIFGLLDTDETIPDPVQPVSWPELKEGITFENVWFSYTGDDNYALKDVSFTIPRGQRFALAGVTGGGKSTIINLLLRFYDVSKGRILVDGIDVRKVSLETLREKIGLVLQDIFLFPGNVASNISLSANGSDRSRIVEACRLVAADDFINHLPDQYETELSERGGNISRGEQQLLSFSRALYFDPQILILDEATSSVDPETERLIQEGLATLMKGRTSIIVAHRLSTILNVDQILVIREGRIIERGNHQELLKQGGYYSKLFKLQFAGNGLNGVQKNVA